MSETSGPPLRSSIQRLHRVSYAPFVPNLQEMQRGLEGVRLHIEQILDLLSRLHSTPTSDPVVRGALLERLVVHLRTILAFLESPTRTVHYASGIRQENPDVRALDYGFSPDPLPLTDRDRRELRRRRASLSYAEDPTRSLAAEWALGALTLPVLRRCAAFAAHILASGAVPWEPEHAAAWERLRLALDFFAILGPGTNIPSRREQT